MKAILRSLLVGLVFFGWQFQGNAQDIVITEISYNPPESGTDSTEYIELYNNGLTTVNLAGWSFGQGVVYTFPNVNLPAGGYFVVAVDSVAMLNRFGFTTNQWTSGGLSNSGEDILLLNSNGDTIDYVDFDDNLPWPVGPPDPDGDGPSIVLCDPTLDNNDPANWSISTDLVSGQVINGNQVYGSPGAGCAPPPPPPSAPEVTGAFVINASTVGIVFNSGVQAPSATNTANYVATPALTISNITINPTPDTVTLNLSTPLANGVLYEMIIDNVEDTASNPMTDPDTVTFLWNVNTPDLVITEIMYNDPSGPDSLEFIEIINNGSSAANLAGLEISEGVTFTFPNTTLNAGAYAIIAKDSAAINTYLGYSGAWQWAGGSLTNAGEDILIVNSIGDTIDYVDYDDASPWNSQADGSGPSLILCDINTDNNDPSNWSVSANNAGTINGTTVFASPGALNNCPAPTPIPTYPIGTINTVDGSGVADSLNVQCNVVGTVLGVDMRGGTGIQFTIHDGTDGIGVFSTADINNYVVTEGDEVSIYGFVTQFNGLTQLNPDSVILLSSGNPIPTPTAVTDLDESTESQLITISGAVIIDPSDWPDGSSTSGYNVELLVGSDTVVMRIDVDTDVELNIPNAPVGAINVTGIGGQFDPSNPFTDGYQFLPRYFQDIDTSVVYAPTLFINEVMASNTSTITDAEGEYEDWIEIYNPNNNDVDLATLFITNDVADPTKYAFPSGNPATIIPANGFLLVWADDGLSVNGPLNANFKLSASGGDYVGLYASNGSDVIDSVSFGPQTADVSWGRETDGGVPWIEFTDPTPGQSNLLSSVVFLTNGEAPLKLFPNPVSNGQLFLNKQVDFEVFTVMGQSVARERNSNQFNTEALAEGMYILRAANGESVRFVVK